MDSARSASHSNPDNLKSIGLKATLPRLKILDHFPNVESCLRLVRALCVAIHEVWREDSRNLNVTPHMQQGKELLELADWIDRG